MCSSQHHHSRSKSLARVWFLPTAKGPYPDDLFKSLKIFSYSIASPPLVSIQMSNLSSYGHSIRKELLGWKLGLGYLCWFFQWIIHGFELEWLSSREGGAGELSLMIEKSRGYWRLLASIFCRLLICWSLLEWLSGPISEWTFVRFSFTRRSVQFDSTAHFVHNEIISGFHKPAQISSCSIFKSLALRENCYPPP